MRYILKSPWSATGTELRERLGWTTLSHRRNLLTLKTIHKCIHKRGPTYLHEKFIKQSDMGNSRTRRAYKLYLHRPRTDFYKNSFEYSGAKLWNSLPASVRDVTSRLGFSHALQCYLHNFLFVHMLLFVNLFCFQICSFCAVHCISVPVLVRQGPPENQLLAEEASLLN